MSEHRFFAASYYDHYRTEDEALKKLPLPSESLNVTTLVGGAKLYRSGPIAAILAQDRNGYALWLSSADMAKETMEQAQAEVEEYEAVRGPGGWKIFEVPA